MKGRWEALWICVICLIALLASACARDATRLVEPPLVASKNCTSDANKIVSGGTATANEVGGCCDESDPECNPSEGPDPQIVTDACAGDCSFLGDATYSTAEAYAASGGNVALMDCPNGCVAYPMGTNSRQRVSDAVAGTHGVVECDAAENWIAAMLAADLIDMFPNTSSNTAWAWWNPSGNEPDGNEHVYIAFKNFYPQNLSSGELAKTLYHEAYHHFHPTTGQADDLSGAAESFANMCYSTK